MGVGVVCVFFVVVFFFGGGRGGAFWGCLFVCLVGWLFVHPSSISLDSNRNGLRYLSLKLSGRGRQQAKCVDNTG